MTDLHLELFLEWWAWFVDYSGEKEFEYLGMKRWEDIWISGFGLGYIDWTIFCHGCLVTVMRIVYFFSKRVPREIDNLSKSRIC